jgi:Domain of unknown function (DUF4349)
VGISEISTVGTGTGANSTGATGRTPGSANRKVPALAAVACVLVMALGLAGLVGSLGGNNDRLHPTVRPGANADARAKKPQDAVPAAATRTALEARAPTRSAAKVAAGPAASQASSPAGTGERIEETGTLMIVVPAARTQPDISQLMVLAQSLGGFVASTETQAPSSGFPSQGALTLQVPVANFATAVARARALGKVLSLSTQATDVTGQYVDLQSQITAAQETRQQYLTIMSKAKTVGAILAVQSQLDDVQSQLQQLEGQLKQLSSETTYATLEINLAQGHLTPPPPKPASGLLKAWRSAVGGFVSGFEGVVRVAGPLLFALLLVGALYLAARFAWRAWHRRQATQEARLP